MPTKRVLIADNHGTPMVCGPVYTDAGVAQLRALVEDAGWTPRRVATQISKAELTVIANRAKAVPPMKGSTE